MTLEGWCPSIAASAASSAGALAGKLVVSAETLTCIYGFLWPAFLRPVRYVKRDQVAHLKLLADSLFAHGVNHIVDAEE